MNDKYPVPGGVIIFCLMVLIAIMSLTRLHYWEFALLALVRSTTKRNVFFISQYPLGENIWTCSHNRWVFKPKHWSWTIHMFADLTEQSVFGHLGSAWTIKANGVICQKALKPLLIAQIPQAEVGVRDKITHLNGSASPPILAVECCCTWKDS